MHDVLAYLQTLHGPERTSEDAAVAAPRDAARAGGLDPAAILNPAADSWPTYHGDYSGRRHSPLTALTPANVDQLTLAWAFETGQSSQIKATPIVVNGIAYITTPDNLWALDARSGRQVWRYTYPTNSGFHIGHRGVAVHKNSVYFTTPDAHLVSLDAVGGAVKWDVVIADSKRGYWSTTAPLVVRDHVIVGVSGDFDNLPGLLKSFDPENGKTQWIFYSTPPPGTPELASGGATGGQMWMTGTYDPELNLVFVGTGNPTPTLNGSARPGDNPWTCSIVAIDPDTGKLAWGFQASPHDTHDWDAAEVPVVVDAPFNGVPRKLLMGGWSLGKPTDAGCCAMFGTRMGCGSRCSSPSRPRPFGSGPIRARPSGVRPEVTKSRTTPSSSNTPSAAYFALATRRASSATFCRTAALSSSDVSAIPATFRACS